MGSCMLAASSSCGISWCCNLQSQRLREERNETKAHKPKEIWRRTMMNMRDVVPCKLNWQMSSLISDPEETWQAGPISSPLRSEPLQKCLAELVCCPGPDLSHSKHLRHGSVTDEQNPLNRPCQVRGLVTREPQEPQEPHQFHCGHLQKAPPGPFYF